MAELLAASIPVMGFFTLAIWTLTPKARKHQISQWFRRSRR